MWLKTEDQDTIINMEQVFYVTIYNEDDVDKKTPYHVKALSPIYCGDYFDVTIAKFKDEKSAREYIDNLHHDIRRMEKEKYYVKN